MGVTRKQARRIMKRAGLRAIYPGKRLSMSKKGNQRHPYLLRGKEIWLPNLVWASDITYIKLPGGHVYLVTIIDVYSRRIMAWGGLEYTTDQRCQFTSDQFISVLESHGIRISMDGIGRALDNILIERFWRTLKYEDIYFRGYSTMMELKAGLARYFHLYNCERFHESLEYETPDEIYYERF
jgi:putative transposase